MTHTSLSRQSFLLSSAMWSHRGRITYSLNGCVCPVCLSPCGVRVAIGWLCKPACPAATPTVGEGACTCTCTSTCTSKYSRASNHWKHDTVPLMPRVSQRCGFSCDPSVACWCGVQPKYIEPLAGERACVSCGEEAHVVDKMLLLSAVFLPLNSAPCAGERAWPTCCLPGSSWTAASAVN